MILGKILLIIHIQQGTGSRALGVQDFSVVGLFVLFGYGSELGTQYAVARRGRDVVFAALGWLLLSVGEVTWQGMRADLENSPSPPPREMARFSIAELIPTLLKKNPNVAVNPAELNDS